MTTATKRSRKKQHKPDRKRPATSAAGALARAVFSENGESDRAFPEWQQHLRRRKQPRSLSELAKCTRSPLLWCLPSEVAGSDALPAIETLAQLSAPESKKQHQRLLQTAAEYVGGWLDHVHTREPSGAFALEGVALAHALPALAAVVEGPNWKRAVAALVDLSRESTLSSAEDPWTTQLFGGELPLSLAYQLPELPVCADLGRAAVKFLSESVDQLLDGMGVPEAPHLKWLRPLLACWIRCVLLVDRCPDLKLKKGAREQLDWMIRQSLRLCRADGQQAFSPPSRAEPGRFSDVVRAALRWSGDATDKALAKLVLEGTDVPERRLPEDPAYHSEWAAIGVLQPEWSPLEPRLVTTFANTENRIEFSTGKQILFSGDWLPQVTINGRTPEFKSEWDVLCWFSDDDVDFLEIEIELSGGWTLQRQFLLARQDYFLYAADALAGPKAADLTYRLEAPGWGDVAYHPEEETQDGMLVGRRPLALVMPLALPEWRTDTRFGKLRPAGANLELTVAHRGRAMYAPLFVDVHRRRMRKAATWRQLTVAEERQIVPRDVATGYRVQVGPEQWLFYRSLRSPANRSVLGQNLSSEFLCGRVLADGDVESLVEIE